MSGALAKRHFHIRAAKPEARVWRAAGKTASEQRSWLADRKTSVVDR
jgi:hypothetical protein